MHSVRKDNRYVKRDAEPETMIHDHGALVGWSANATGARLVLTLESVDTPPPHDHGDVRRFTYALTRSQAANLAHILLEIGDLKPPSRRAGLIERLIG